MRYTSEVFQKYFGGINMWSGTNIPTTSRDLFPTVFSGKLITALLQSVWKSLSTQSWKLISSNLSETLWGTDIWGGTNIL